MCTPRKAVEAMIRHLRVASGASRGKAKDLWDAFEAWSDASNHTPPEWVLDYADMDCLSYPLYAHTSDDFYIQVDHVRVVLWSKVNGAISGYIMVMLSNGRIGVYGHPNSLAESLARTVQDVSPF